MINQTVRKRLYKEIGIPARFGDRGFKKADLCPIWKSSDRRL
jgi:hypothetical protein